MGWTLAELARRLGGEVLGDDERVVERLRPLALAGPADLSFLVGRRHAAAARASAAGALLVGPDAPALAHDRIVVAKPASAVVDLLELLHPKERRQAGVHPKAEVAESANVDPTAAVGPFAVIGEGATIGAGSTVHAHAVVGDGAVVGAGATLHPHVVLYAGVRVGDGAEIHAGSVLGGDGFGYVATESGHRKIPQVGGLEIGSRVEIGALSAIDRGALDDTRVGAGSKIDNLVQVGHNVQIGRDVLICGQVGIAGSAEIGDRAVLAGGAGVSDHVVVGAGAQIAATSVALRDVGAGQRVAGIPAVEMGEWKRRRAIEARLVEIWRTVRRLAARIEGAGETDRRGGKS